MSLRQNYVSQAVREFEQAIDDVHEHMFVYLVCAVKQNAMSLVYMVLFQNRRV